jgi:hypothetical protein
MAGAMGSTTASANVRQREQVGVALLDGRVVVRPMPAAAHVEYVVVPVVEPLEVVGHVDHVEQLLDLERHPRTPLDFDS